MTESNYAAYESKWMKYDTCPGCGGQKSRSALACRRCRSKSKELLVAWKPCLTCGEREIRGSATKCFECLAKEREAARPRCVDCGVVLVTAQSKNRPVTRCWECSVKHRQNSRARLCSVEGCGQQHMAKGLCRMHYQIEQRRKREALRAQGGIPHQSGQLKLPTLLKAFPCQICGYDRLRSRIHRIVPGGLYRPPNIAAVCSRCHDEIHAGITEPPKPLSAEEIMAGPNTKQISLLT